MILESLLKLDQNIFREQFRKWNWSGKCWHGVNIVIMFLSAACSRQLSPSLDQSEASIVRIWPMRGQQTDQLPVYHLLTLSSCGITNDDRFSLYRIRIQHKCVCLVFNITLTFSKLQPHPIFRFWTVSGSIFNMWNGFQAKHIYQNISE